MPSATFIGQRPEDFIFGYDETEELCKMIKKEMLSQICWLYEEKGVRVFYSGCDLGVDLWAAEILLDLRKDGYSDLKLVCVLPYLGHDEKWTFAQRERLCRILRDADYKIILPNINLGVVRKYRKFFMIDCSNYLITVHENPASKKKRTTPTMAYAMKNEKNIIYINPYTAKVFANFNM